MHPDLEKLAEADAHDRELKALKQARAEAEAEAAEASRSAEAAGVARAAVEAALAATRARQRELNRELETYAARRGSALRVLESGVGDPDAAERQLAQVAEIVDGLETELLERMEAEEAEVQGLTEATAAAEAAHSARDRILQALPARVEALRARWEVVQPQRDAALDALDRVTRQKYIDLRDRKGRAVAEVVKEACQGCHVVVHPQHLADLRRGLLLPCRGCARWLIPPEG